MAMSFPSPDALASPQQQGNANNNNSDSTSASSNNNNNSGSSTSPITSSNDPNFPSNDQATAQNQSAPPIGVKRKPNRRANTAERRATHNAVERQRRETLNGRFIDLANLLPNLSQIRRPSKSSIVNSSIAHIQASRHHRMIASRELRMLKNESDALRRELNEWRDRAGLPRVEEPVRGDCFGMVLAGELEVISGISIEEEDEDADDGFGVSLAMGGMPSMSHHAAQQHQQQMASYGGAYMDDGDDDAALLGPMYPQQAAGIHHHHHPMRHAPQHLMHHQQQQQHAMMAAAHDIDDPRVAAMLMKNANPFAHNISGSAASPTGYPTINTRSTYPTNDNTTWVTSPANYGASTHLFTPPATSHGLPTPTVTAGSNSNSGSPVGGVSVNGGSGIIGGSPVSTSSSLSGRAGGASPLSIITTHDHMGNGHRQRRNSGSGSLSTAGNSPGGQSPIYEFHPTVQVYPAMQDYAAGVSRMAGMRSSTPFVPSHNHPAAHGGLPVQQAVGVGGGVNGAMMMMMM
jgi:hypothetical protein